MFLSKDSNATLESNDQFARVFKTWDTNNDGIIENQEVSSLPYIEL